MFLSTADWMSVVEWSRAQFAMTAMYHWIFVPLTLGLGFICAIMETNYYRTGKEFWKRTAKFWMRLFGINFACGVATGIILEFEFGTNWSNYSHFVGDIFGAPLAIEGIIAFFLEATFIAVMFFGWNRVSKRFHLISTWMVAIGATLSALWILVANAWMQSPEGMTFNLETARNEMTDFWAVLFSPVAINKFLHTVTSSFMLAAVFVMGVSAWYMLKGREWVMARKSMLIAAVFGLIFALVAAWTGDGSAQQVARVQPMKLAAMEALYDGERGAGLTVVSLLRPEEQRVSNETAHWGQIQIPKLLSWMSYRDGDAYVAGINDLVNGNPSEGLIPTAEKIERGRVAIAEMGRFRAAKLAGDRAAMDSIARKFDRTTAEGRAFHHEYFRYFGYGYLESPRDVVPPIGLTYYTFRIMVGLGLFFIVLFVVTLVLLRRHRIEKRRWWLWTMLWSIPLAYIASQAGWIVAEVGRQPWAIQDLLPTVAAVSKLDPASVKTTFFIFLVLFAVLLAADIMIMARQIKLGPGSLHEKNPDAAPQINPETEK